MIQRMISRIGAWFWLIGAIAVAGFLLWRYKSLTDRVQRSRTGANHAEEARRLGKDVETMELMRNELETDARTSAALAQKVKGQAVAKAREIRERGFEGMGKLVEDWNAGA